MNRTRWRLLYLVLSLGSAFLASPATAQSDAEFPIGFWWGPPASHNTHETWQTVKDAHFTFVGPSRRLYTRAESQLQMTLAADVGLKVMVSDERLNTRNLNQPSWWQGVKDVTTDFKTSQNFFGYYIYDEPSADLFPQLRDVYAFLKTEDPQHAAYSCLFPTYANASQLGTYSYESYLQKYLSIVNPEIVSHDHYPINRGTQDYFYNLEVVRAASVARELPFWNVIQGLTWLGPPPLRASQLRWQVYTSLAYGVKGLLYFYYWPEPQIPGYEQAIVDQQGRPNPEYFMIQDINAEIAVVGRKLMNLHSRGIYHTGAPTIPKGTTALPAIFPMKILGPSAAVIGYLEGKQDDAYVMLVNRDMDRAQTLRLQFEAPVRQVLRLSPQDGSFSELSLNGGQTEIALAAGDGVLLRLIDHSPTFDLPFNNNSDVFAKPSEANSLSQPVISDGYLTTTITGRDPYMVWQGLRLVPNDTDQLTFAMRVPDAQRAQIFWTTNQERFFDDRKHIEVQLHGDDQMHEYQVDLGSSPLWHTAQTIRALRIDPVRGDESMGQIVTLDYVLVERR